MVVLSRKQNEAIIIGGKIRVVVAEISGDKVRLGVTADPEVSIHREEINRNINQGGYFAELAEMNQDDGGEG